MTNRRLKLVRLDVTREDIEEMYARYDSGMADLTTCNAISLALQRVLRSEYRPSIHCAANHHGCQLQIGSEFFPLSSGMYWWLDRANCGNSVKPISFAVALPENLLREEDLSEKNQKGRTTIAA